MKYLSLIIVMLISSAFAVDRDTVFLPTHARDVTKAHPDREKIEELIIQFVGSTESRDKKKFLTLVTANFLETTQWDKDWNRMQPTVAPALMTIQDVFIMELKGRHYVRFAVKNRAADQIIRLPRKTWYEVRNADGVWKMQAYLPNFEPDSGP